MAARTLSTASPSRFNDQAQYPWVEGSGPMLTIRRSFASGGARRCPVIALDAVDRRLTRPVRI